MSKGVYASSSVAKIKGFDTDSLTYIDDLESEQKVIAGSAYTYGYVQQWASTYKKTIIEDDGSKTLYIFVFCESTINSVGKKRINLKNNYFRNKKLSTEVSLIANQDVKVIDFTTSDNESLVETSKQWTFDTGVTGGVSTTGPEAGVSISGGFTVTYTTSHKAVLLESSKSNITSGKKVSFDYTFSNWKDGSVGVPNTGTVIKREYAIFSIENCNDDDESEFSLNVTTTATIFRDKLGTTNYTCSDSVSFAGIGGNLNN